MQYPSVSILPDVALPYSTQVPIHQQAVKVPPQPQQTSESIPPAELKTGAVNDEHPEEALMEGKARKLHHEYSPETIAFFNTTHSLVGMLITALRHERQMTLRGLTDYISRHMNEMIRQRGKRVKGSLERIVGGALNSSKSFMIVGHGVWALNPEMAREEEKEMFLRNLEREKRRKRKRQHPLSTMDPTEMAASPEEIQMCLEQALLEIQALNSSGLVDEAGSDHASLLSFIQQDPFAGIPLQDTFHDLPQKLGDENFCFIMQFFNFFHDYLTRPNDVAARTLPRIDMALQEIRETKAGAAQQSLALEELNEVPALDMAKRRRTSQDNDLLFNETSFPLNLSENVPAYSTMPSVAPITSMPWQSALTKETMGSSIQIPFTHFYGMPIYSASHVPTAIATTPSALPGSQLYESDAAIKTTVGTGPHPPSEPPSHL